MKWGRQTVVLVAWALTACVDSWSVHPSPAARSSRRPGGLCAARLNNGGEGRRREGGDILAAISPLLDKSQGKRKQQAKRKKETAGSHGERRGPEIGAERALEFEREGHTKLPGLVSDAALERLVRAVQTEYDLRANEAYTKKLRDLGVSRDAIPRVGVKAALEKACRARGLPMPALQVYNLHRADRPSSKVVRELAMSAHMGRTAADLLGVDSVMLYQTGAFFKFAGDGETPWHSDLNTAPFDTNDMVTFWIALTNVPTLEHSALAFASRSHRDFALAYWHTLDGMKELDTRGYKVAKFSPLSAGDATAHHGWLVHAAPPNESQMDRKALTVSYVAAHARRLGTKGTRLTPNDVDRKGYTEEKNLALVGNTHESWIPEISPGKPVKHELLPIVYRRPGARGGAG